jgi:hypothetical protein
LRISINFHIIIAGMPPDDDGMNEPDPVYHARQAQLLAAVKSNPAVLKQWMYGLIVSQMNHKELVILGCADRRGNRIPGYARTKSGSIIGRWSGVFR